MVDGMNCEHAAASDLASRYVAGHLDPAEQDAFERHYFECARCFDEVQLQLSIQKGVRDVPIAKPAQIYKGWVAWAAIAATVVVMASIGFWRLRIPARPPQPVASVTPQADPLELLARVEPPPYQAPALRGAAGDAHFRQGMEHYRQGIYAAAIDELSQADPRSPDVQLFLGISYLMRNQPDAAVSHLRATLQLGDSLDLEPAHFYLAKALLRRRDVPGAARELEAAAAMHGDYEKQSRELLERLKQSF